MFDATHLIGNPFFTEQMQWDELLEETGKTMKYKAYAFRELLIEAEGFGVQYLSLAILIPLNTTAFLNGVRFVADHVIENGKTKAMEDIDAIEKTPVWFQELYSESVEKVKKNKTDWDLRLLMGN